MKAPAFQCYPSDDFLADLNFIAMNASERGIYLTLYFVCWIQESLPASPERLARVCGVTKEDIEAAWPSIAPCFVKDGETYRHPKLDEKRAKQEAYREQKVLAGRLGGRPKKAEVISALPDEKRKEAEVIFAKAEKSSPPPSPSPSPEEKPSSEKQRTPVPIDADSPRKRVVSQQTVSKADFCRDFVDRLLLLHPKKVDRLRALDEAEALYDTLTSEGGDARSVFTDTVEVNHAAWCRTEPWKEKNGVFAPKLADWLSSPDRQWKYWPAGVPKPTPKYIPSWMTSGWLEEQEAGLA